MTLDEYQQSKLHSKEIKSAKSLMSILAVGIGVAIAFYLFSIVLKLFEINDVIGYIGTVVSIIIFGFLYLVPVLKIYRSKTFITKVTSANVDKAQKHNKRLREELADNMIDAVSKVDGLDWYADDQIKNLAIARHTRNDNELKKTLSAIYSTNIKKTSDSLIRKCALQVGVSTAISQSDMIDSLLILVFETKLIKDLVYLYGYRPSDSEMVIIMKKILRNSFLAYGISITAEGLGQIVSGAMGTIPIVGSLVSSGIQGITNGSFAVMIGLQTRKFLINNFHLQDMLDNVILDSIEEDEKLFSAVAEDVKKGRSKSKTSKKLSTDTATI